MTTTAERCPWCGSVISHQEFVKIETRIREEERRRTTATEATLKKQIEEQHRRDLEAAKRSAEAQGRESALKQFQGISAEREQLAKKVQALESQASTIRKQAEHDAEKKVQKQLADQRASLEREKHSQLLKARSEFSRERENYLKRMHDLERKLQHNTANELGDGAEIDLYEDLRKEKEFQNDTITRTRKGEPGADIRHEVFYKGQLCGHILYDSKNRQAWQNSFVKKLREDQVGAKAEHAVLATTVFPKGQKELYVDDGVIVVNPARAVYIARLLRGAMIKLHQLGLSAKERSGKLNQLYNYITSEVFQQNFRELERVTNDALDLDVMEQEQHKKTWNKRGALLKRIENVLRDIDMEVSAIIERAESDKGAPRRAALS